MCCLEVVLQASHLHSLQLLLLEEEISFQMSNYVIKRNATTPTVLPPCRLVQGMPYFLWDCTTGLQREAN